MPIAIYRHKHRTARCTRKYTFERLSSWMVKKPGCGLVLVSSLAPPPIMDIIRANTQTPLENTPSEASLKPCVTPGCAAGPAPGAQ